MGRPRAQPSRTHWTEWSCHQCGSPDRLERDPELPEVAYCAGCWGSWGGWASDSAAAPSSNIAAKGRGKAAGKGKGKAAGSGSRGGGKGKGGKKARQGGAKGAGKSDERVESRSEEELQQMATKADQVFESLPDKGRRVWRCLKSCIRSTLRAGVVHFERALRAELEVEIGEFEMQRQAGSQWVVTIRDGGRRPVVCHASVRSEVLGGRTAGLLADLKREARVVKNTLLEGGASWLRELTDGVSDRTEFLEEVRERRELGDDRKGKGKGKGKDEGGYGDGGASESEEERCPICAKALSQDRLGGRHMCRIVVSFTCCGRWTSHAGRYNLEERRVMGQRCQRCGQEGTPADEWQLARDADFGGDVEKPHRSELCEACDRYGNCRGAFFDPFQMSLAVESLTGQPAQWHDHAGGHIWTTRIGDEIVVLQPHVHVSIG